MKKAESTKSIISRLIALKLQLDSMKPVYAEYDKTLEKALRIGKIPDKISIDGKTYVISVTDAFSVKNTAWKSVAQRRYDVSISRKV